MTEVVSLSPLQIPTVTQEDLYAFHARVFGYPAPSQLFGTEQEPYKDASYDEIYQVENDDLGYYADGAKRTLTDEQIAMFRHSEIYSILRERQVHKENLEADGTEPSNAMVSQPEEAVDATVSSDEEGEVQSDGEVKEIFATAPKVDHQRVEATHARKKRKREDTDASYVHGGMHASRSVRGFVRELDSAAAEDQILDYGDEPSIIEEPKQDEIAAAQVPEQDRESQARPAEGRKIWWPIIAAP